MDGFYFVDSTTSDWDLQAIVKGCNSPDNMISKPSSYAWFQSRSHGEEYERCESEAFEPLKAVNSGTTSIHGHHDSKSPTRVQKKKAVGVSCVDSQGVTKERRRKPKQKISFVQQVAGDRALSDNWNWRKYGQKTIKGSPYPRSYYKCSSSGDCLARKQVEHSSNDPGTFLITYLNEHNHPYPSRRHSQAGRTKERFDASSGGLSTSKSSAGTAKSSSLESPFGDHDCVLALKCDKDEGSLEDVRAVGEDGEVGVSNMAWDDEFFAGLEYLGGLEINGSIM